VKSVKKRDSRRAVVADLKTNEQRLLTFAKFEMSAGNWWGASLDEGPGWEVSDPDPWRIATLFADKSQRI